MKNLQGHFHFTAALPLKQPESGASTTVSHSHHPTGFVTDLPPMIFTAGTSSETFVIKVTVPLSVPENLEGKASSLPAFLKQRCKYEIQTHRHGSQGQVKWL